MIELRGVAFGYTGPADLFADFNWSVQMGEAWAVVGPSGCGKTTLLYLLAGLRRPTCGQVLIDGRSLNASRPATGLILQDYGLLPWARAWDNVALGLRIRGTESAEIRHRVEHWMRRLNIYDLHDKYPRALSGGQRQRVAIARTLTIEPDLLLMDEPFSSLDAFTREDLQGLAVSLLDEGERVSVLVTHDVQEAVFVGQRILVLGRAPTRSATIIENPEAHRATYRGTPAFFEMCSRVRAAVAAQMEENQPQNPVALDARFQAAGESR
ncbi:MAG: ATP-binding cassette domain-containing protein [Chloroflexota bacterium]|nr:MAG: ATP-binding cassette domain-containing protein [Chloroflexota bacterium]